MHSGSSSRHAAPSQPCVALTPLTPEGIIIVKLNKSQRQVSIAKKLLTPLREGKPVALIVDDPRLPKRKRIEKPVLFLTPLTVYGKLSTKLMVSLQTYGCEVVDTLEKITPTTFYRMGLSARLAGILADELNQVFTQGEVHGNRSEKP